MMKKIMTAASLALITMSLVAASAFARDFVGHDARGNIQERHNQVAREAQPASAEAESSAKEAPQKAVAPARKARANKR